MHIGKYDKLFGVGPLGLLISLICLYLLWLLDRSLGHAAILNRPEPMKLIGICLLVIWFCWHFWCMKTIRQWWQHDRLCTTGPYRFVRHPIYAGGTLLGTLGISLLFNSWIILLLPVIQFLINSFLVRKEEDMMTSVFGEEYQIYAAKTGRLFPKLFS